LRHRQECHFGLHADQRAKAPAEHRAGTATA
jgi:hypothetical protein